jgi:site-specific recombinase XerD
VARILARPNDRKHRLLLMTAYGAGLRVSELVALRVGDLDADRMTIRVQQGKGSRDRYTLLSPRLLEEFRVYTTLDSPERWLFPSRGRQEPISISCAQRVWGRAKREAGVSKCGGIHALRHAFATHLLEDGTDLHTIQRLLGHRHIGTTMLYFHLARRGITERCSPLDGLPAVSS